MTGWDHVDRDTFTSIHQRTLGILTAPEVPAMLRHFYDPSADRAGATFHTLQPIHPYDIEASDLLAITLMDVTVSPRAVRTMLAPGPTRDALRESLRQVRPDVTLADADADTLDAAASLYERVKQVLGGNKWVTASKICARKRPALVPVRDSVVVEEMHLPNTDFRGDWTLFRALVRDREIVAALEGLAADAAAVGADLQGVPTVRLLDSAVWMHRRAVHDQPVPGGVGE